MRDDRRNCTENESTEEVVGVSWCCLASRGEETAMKVPDFLPEEDGVEDVRSA